jgi:hypothetical protein
MSSMTFGKRVQVAAAQPLGTLGWALMGAALVGFVIQRLITG